MLVRIYVDVALRQCLIGGDIVGEGDDGHFEAFFFGFFGDKFHDLFRVARCRADFDFIFCFRRVSRRGVFFIAAAACDEACTCQCGQGNDDSFFQIHNTYLSFLKIIL